MLKEGRYQYGAWLYALLVMLWDMVEKYQSCVMHHSTLHKMPLV